MNAMNRIVFLVDVDNTLLDNDYIQAELKSHLARQYGPACRDRYWAILEDLFRELGYRDYLGALQRYRVEHPQDMDLLSMSSFLVDNLRQPPLPRRAGCARKVPWMGSNRAPHRW
jgi:hypothetical protein